DVCSSDLLYIVKDAIFSSGPDIAEIPGRVHGLGRESARSFSIKRVPVVDVAATPSGQPARLIVGRQVLPGVSGIVHRLYSRPPGASSPGTAEPANSWHHQRNHSADSGSPRPQQACASSR